MHSELLLWLLTADDGSAQSRMSLSFLAVDVCLAARTPPKGDHTVSRRSLSHPPTSKQLPVYTTSQSPYDTFSSSSASGERTSERSAVEYPPQEELRPLADRPHRRPASPRLARHASSAAAEWPAAAAAAAAAGEPAVPAAAGPAGRQPSGPAGHGPAAESARRQRPSTHRVSTTRTAPSRDLNV
jgi:hypothetical protein